MKKNDGTVLISSTLAGVGVWGLSAGFLPGAVLLAIAFLFLVR